MPVLLRNNQIMDKPVFHKSGFTLTEIIVASVILATAVAGLFASFIAAKRYSVQSKSRLMAVHNAQYILESLRQDVRADTWNLSSSALSTGIHPVSNTMLSGELVAKYNATAQYNVEQGPSPNGYRAVTLTIHWDEP